jgi:hypothetical protein
MTWATSGVLFFAEACGFFKAEMNPAETVATYHAGTVFELAPAEK